MKTRIVKHTHSTFNLNSWRDKTITYYTVEYKTWIGWRRVCECQMPFFTNSTIECPDYATASKLKKYVDDTGNVRICHY